MWTEPLQKEVGLVRATKHYLVSIEGLPSAHVHDIVIGEDGARALVTSLQHDAVEAMLLDGVDVRPGQRFELSEQTSQLSIGDHLFGRVINALGDPVDGMGAFPPKNTRMVLEREAGNIAHRSAVVDQFLTGYTLTDTVLPIGKGQRQLLMGPIQSGTDVFCREVIKNQSKENMVCIYSTVGKPVSSVMRLAAALFEGDSKQYTTVVTSTSQDSAPLNAIAPAVALQIAEFFCDQGRDVLLIFDDLYTHAKYLREIALLEGRLPGRESYPGDIFFQQAHLIERAGSFLNKGSITLLPVLQTDIESYTDLIMTNIMGTTDGHMSFSSNMYAQGVFPPVSEEESVTRVGKHTQTVVQKQLSTSVTSVLAEAHEQERYVQFGTQVSESSRAVIQMGRILRVLLDQNEGDRLDRETQVILLALVFTTFATDKDEVFMRTYYRKLRDAIRDKKEFKSLHEEVRTGESLPVFLKHVEAAVPAFKKICQT
jgi:F-type H+-transporting ATPase subunit alpha